MSLAQHLKQNEIQYALLRLPGIQNSLGGKFNESTRDVFIYWLGPQVKILERGRKKTHLVGTPLLFLILRCPKDPCPFPSWARSRLKQPKCFQRRNNSHVDCSQLGLSCHSLNKTMLYTRSAVFFWTFALLSIKPNARCFINFWMNWSSPINSPF